MSKSNKAKLLTIYISCMVLIASFVGYSYSIFSANVTYTNKTNTVLKADTLTMTFRGLNEVSCSNIIPGDKCIKTFEVQNTSSIATYYNIYMEDVTNGFDSYLVYTLKDGNTEVIPETATPNTRNGKTYILTNITIPANTTKSYTLTIEYKYSPTVDQSNTQGHEFRTKVGIDTVQGAEVLAGPKCKRATQLHNDGTHTYGSLGTTGTLASGDAFDCKVSTTGGYTERFYYVSTKTNGVTTDANTAVLVASSNYVDGPIAWSQSNDNTTGPTEAIKNLPTITQWDNVSLTSTTRDITYENNTVAKQNFEYKVGGVDNAARLLTVQEVNAACGITIGSFTEGELDNCNYLMENTVYDTSSGALQALWLESPCAAYGGNAWRVDGYYRAAAIYNYGTMENRYYGARPAIEVAITDIEY